MKKETTQLFVIHKANHNSNYTVISNDILKNKELTLRLFTSSDGHQMNGASPFSMAPEDLWAV